jgi:hypothetical protein
MRLRHKSYVWLKIAKANLPFLRRIRLLKKAPRVESYGDRSIVEPVSGNSLLYEYVSSQRPIAAGKIGDTELEVLLKYEQSNGDADTFFRSITEHGHELDLLHLNCGVFPKRQDVLVRWAETYLAALADIDLLGVWHNKGEEEIVKKYAPQATLTGITAVEPYYFDAPWTRALADKRVVVVTPFHDSVLHQWSRYRGEDLFPENPDVLPEFDLVIVRSPFSAGLSAPVHADWHVALADMKETIVAIDFDVALIGAGAWGLPLCSFIRRDLERSAVHLGGAIQILFGVRGRRWERHLVISKLFNEKWISPLLQERPKGTWRNDGGAYW